MSRCHHEVTRLAGNIVDGHYHKDKTTLPAAPSGLFILKSLPLIVIPQPVPALLPFLNNNNKKSYRSVLEYVTIYGRIVRLMGRPEVDV